MNKVLPMRPPHSYRDDPSVPAFDDAGPRTVMDARCGLCARGARWIAHNDRARAFRIVPMQSPLGRALFTHYGLDPDDPSSWLLIHEGRAFTATDAILRTGALLGGPWRALALLRLLPFRDAAYHAVARNRYRLSRPADLCALPDPEIQARLLQ